jgi:hypothetical protein
VRSEELIACARNVRKARLPVLLEVPGEVQAGEFLVAGAQQHQVEGVEVAVTGLLLHHAGLLQQVVVDVSANGVACHRGELSFLIRLFQFYSFIFPPIQNRLLLTY